jgi:hypothetical protein
VGFHKTSSVAFCAKKVDQSRLNNWFTHNAERRTVIVDVRSVRSRKTASSKFGSTGWPDGACWIKCNECPLMYNHQASHATCNAILGFTSYRFQST